MVNPALEQPSALKFRNKKCPEYIAWIDMKARCLNPKSPAYGYYGRRGVNICPQWINDFKAFFGNVGLRPNQKYSLDRINNNGNYEPGNVRWATRLDQANNTRYNRILIFNGKTQSMAQWSRELALSSNTILWRLNHGWSIEKTLSMPPLPRKRFITYNGKTKIIKQWAAEFKINRHTFRSRLNLGWSIEKALITPIKKLSFI